MYIEETRDGDTFQKVVRRWICKYILQVPETNAIQKR